MRENRDADISDLTLTMKVAWLFLILTSQNHWKISTVRVLLHVTQSVIGVESEKSQLLLCLSGLRDFASAIVTFCVLPYHPIISSIHSDYIVAQNVIHHTPSCSGRKSIENKNKNTKEGRVCLVELEKGHIYVGSKGPLGVHLK